MWTNHPGSQDPFDQSQRVPEFLLIDHSREVKNLVETAYADLPRTKRQEVTLDLFCNLLNYAYLQRHLLAIKLQSLSEAVEAGS